MKDRTPFNPLQAQEVAEAFNAAGVDYLFLDKSGAILLGFPGTTQDVDIFPAKSEENGRRMVAALLQLGFELDQGTQADILRDRDFVQLKNGPFDLDLLRLTGSRATPKPRRARFAKASSQSRTSATSLPARERVGA